jgi:hypothetical protein
MLQSEFVTQIRGGNDSLDNNPKFITLKAEQNMMVGRSIMCRSTFSNQELQSERRRSETLTTQLKQEWTLSIRGKIKCF